MLTIDLYHFSSISIYVDLVLEQTSENFEIKKIKKQFIT